VAASSYSDDVIPLAKDIYGKILTTNIAKKVISYEAVIKSDRMGNDIVIGRPKNHKDRMAVLMPDFIYLLAAVLVFLLTFVIWPNFKEESEATLILVAVTLLLRMIFGLYQNRLHPMEWQVKQ
jgi:hypothetical protein